MKKKLINPPARQEEIDFFTYLGEALLKTQFLEQALSHAITLKTNPSVSKEVADKVLNKTLTYTLGKAIKLAQEENLYPDLLQEELNNFLTLRNWLVHKVVAENTDSIYFDVKKQIVIKKIKSISNEAPRLQHEIELDMIAFCASKGKDMSNSLALVKTREAQ